ncbi:MAG: hypothetical protein DRI94_12590 [Bacteroidetes bacterium]|nr:MAG: hypothetical protein DRI94_12590 [Bacteroidota bacterium]
MIRQIIILSLTLISFNVFSQNDLDLKINFKNIKNSDLYLGYYYGKKTYVIDTVKINDKGFAEFKSADKLPVGLYFIALPNLKYFEIILDKNQKFTVNVKDIKLLEKISFENSQQNTNFYKYKINIAQLFVKSGLLVNRLQINRNNKDSIFEIQKQINTFNKKIKNYKLKVITNNKGTFLAEMINSMIEPDINEFNKLPQNTNMQIQNKLRYQYYKNHFFDNYNFSNPSLLRSQILDNKLNLFFKKVLKHNPDTIINEIKKLTKKAEKNKSVYIFTIDWLFNYYKDYNKKLGYDKIFVFLVDNFIKTNKITWIDDKTKQIYLQTAEILRPVLIGKIAPELKLKNQNDTIVSLTKKYADVTILLFWSLDDEKSSQAIIDIIDALIEFKDKDIQVYSVCVNSNINDWKSTPLTERKNWINVCDDLNKVNSSGYYLQKVPRIMILDYQKKILTNNAKSKNLKRILSRIL